MVLVYAMCGLISVLAEQSVMEMVVIHLHTKLTAYILHTYTFTLIIFHFWTFNLMTHKIESIHIYFTISLASYHWSSCHHLTLLIWHSVTVRPPCLLLTDWDGPESGPRSPAASGRPLDSAPRPPVHQQPAANTAACVYHIMYYILCCLYIAHIITTY